MKSRIWTPYQFLCKRFVEAALQAASTKRLHKNWYGVVSPGAYKDNHPVVLQLAAEVVSNTL